MALSCSFLLALSIQHHQSVPFGWQFIHCCPSESQCARMKMKLVSVWALSVAHVQALSIRSRDGWHSAYQRFLCCVDSHLGWHLLFLSSHSRSVSLLSAALCPRLIWRNNGEMCYEDTAEVNFLLFSAKLQKHHVSVRGTLLCFLMLL